MRHLPVIPSAVDALDAVEIPVPCEVPWDGMAGNEQVRHCGECRQNVYNVAAFTRSEALQLLASRSGRVCLRIFRRPDGTVVTSDCRERLRAARKRGWLVFAGALLIVAWAQLCAQFVGLMGLRRLVGGGVMGSPPVSVPRPPPAPATDAPFARMGEVAPPVEKLMGKRSPEVKGRIKVKTMGKSAARE